MKNKYENRRKQKLLALALTAGIVLGQAAALSQLALNEGLFQAASPITYREYSQNKTVQVTNAAELQQALSGAVYGTTIVLANDITLSSPLSLQKQNVAIKMQSARGTVTLKAAAGRHLGCAGSNIDLFFENVVLDGGGTGGGISSAVEGLSLNGAVIQNCYTSGNGGGVEVSGGMLEIEQGTIIQNNKAAAYGGGISLGANTVLQMDGGAIRNNAAGAYGGGIFGGVSSRIQIDAGAVENNQAILGGGVYSGLRCDLQMTGGVIAKNTALGAAADTGKGGGIYSVTADVQISGGSLYGNQAYNGGGIYATGDGSDIIVSNGLLYENRAVGSDALGGGIFLDTAYFVPNTLTLNSGSIQDNEAVRGGGVFAGGSNPSPATTNFGASVPAVITINEGAVSNNSAAYGGGLYADSGAEIYLGGGSLSGNSAQDGGAIWVQPLEQVRTEQEASFYGNKAATAVYSPNAKDMVTHRRYIRTTQFSEHFVYGYNNYDIVYEGGTTQPQIWTVIFDHNGADGAPESTQKSVPHGDVLGELPQPAREGYRLAGWYTAVEGGTRVTSSTPVTEDLVLYARWEAQQYTLFLDYNGAEPPGAEFTKLQVEFSQPIGFLPIPVKGAESVFAGWFDERGKHYFPATIYRVAGDVQLKARWETVTYQQYTITFFYADEAEHHEEEQRIVAEAEEIGPLPEPQRPGYAFEGWFDQSGNGPYEESMPILGDISLYAQWRAVPWKVTFHYRGGEDSGLPLQVEVDHGQAINRLPQPVRIGYQFKGWYTGVEAGSAVTEQTAVTGDLDLFAWWEAEPYYIRFDYQGAQQDGMPRSKPVTYGGKIGALPIPNKGGHMFAGWFTQPEGGGRYIGGGTSGKLFAQQQDLAVYANWEENYYHIFFDYQGGQQEADLRQKEVTYGNNVGYLPFPQREGHRFGGWFTQPQGKGEQYFVGTTYQTQDDITLYAYWAAETAAWPVTDRPEGRSTTNPGREWNESSRQQDTDNPNTGATRK